MIGSGVSLIRLMENYTNSWSVIDKNIHANIQHSMLASGNLPSALDQTYSTIFQIRFGTLALV